MFVCFYFFLEENNSSLCGHVTCHSNATCTITKQCVCFDGFVGNGTSCQSKNHEISPNTKKTFDHQIVQNESESGLDATSEKQIFNPGAFTLYTKIV